MMMAMRIVVVAALVIPGALSSVSESGRRPQVAIESGVVEGVRLAALPAGGGFLGIPYAAQPVGRLRWREPQRPPAWQEIRDGSKFGPACPQRPSPWLPEMLGVRAMATDEACLYLNVWTPDLHPRNKLPVFVWVHGGGNVEGSGEWPPLGETLAQQGVVVVTINYRLGVFGFLASRWATAESPVHVSGNYGHLDQIQALRWVRKNIARFGGDPQQVTIGGESSGALDVCNLMTSPLTAGLFERALMQSGVCVDSVYPNLHAAEASGEKLAKDLGVASGPAALRALRGIATEKVLAAAAADDALDLEPNIDGRVLPQQAAVAFARGSETKVPVLVGSNEDEISIFASPIVGGRSYRPKMVTEYRSWLERKFGTNADAVFAAYPAHSDDEVGGVFVRMDTDFDFGFGAWLLANDTAQIGRNAFLYHFTYVGKGAFAGLGAFHSEENMFLSQRYWTSWVADPEDAAMSRTLIGYWVQFVKTGNPNGGGLPAWAAYSDGDGECQELGRRVGPERVPGLGQWAIFQKYLTERLQKAAN
jgi:para-nitrobenzyl esterase